MYQWVAYLPSLSGTCCTATGRESGRTAAVFTRTYARYCAAELNSAGREAQGALVHLNVITRWATTPKKTTWLQITVECKTVRPRQPKDINSTRHNEHHAQIRPFFYPYRLIETPHTVAKAIARRQGIFVFEYQHDDNSKYGCFELWLKPPTANIVHINKRANLRHPRYI